MTAETEFRKELSEISEVSIDENCGLDMRSYEDLPKVGGDCNGAHEPVSGGHGEVEIGGNGNLIGKDDPDGSYVFVSRSNSANGDLIDKDLHGEEHVKEFNPNPQSTFGSLNNDVEVQDGQFNVENGETVCPESKIIDEGTEAPSSVCSVGPVVLAVKPEEDGSETIMTDEAQEDQNGVATVELEPKQLDSELKVDEPIQLNSASDLGLQGIQQSPFMILDADDSQLDNGEARTRENADLECVTESDETHAAAQLRVVPKYQIMGLDVGTVDDGEGRFEDENNSEASVHAQESEAEKVLALVATVGTSPLIDDIKMNSQEESKFESDREIEKSQESKSFELEAAACKLPEVEIRKENSEEETKSETPWKIKEILAPEITIPQSSNGSCQLDNGKEKLEEPENTVIGIGSKDYEESDPVVDVGEEVATLANEADVPPLQGTVSEYSSDETKDVLPQVEDSYLEIEVLNQPIDVSIGNENISSSFDCAPVERVFSCSDKDEKLEVDIDKSTLGDHKTSSSNSEADKVLHSVGPEDQAPVLSSTSVDIETENPNGATDSVCCEPVSLDEDLGCQADDSLQNGNRADMKLEYEIENSSTIGRRDVTCNDAYLSQSEVLDTDGKRSEVQDDCIGNSGNTANCLLEVEDIQNVEKLVNEGNLNDYDKLKDQKSEVTELIDRDDISQSTFKGSNTNVLEEQSEGLELVKRPFHFLLKIPRYDDVKLREQIEQAKQQVEEKTRQRDVTRAEIEMKRAKCKELQHDLESARSEEKSARGLVKLKREEIESVLTVLNRVKNAITVEEIDVSIRSKEHKIQHETLPLKEEKHLIREIKQLKHLREQLYSNMGSQDEVRQHLDQRDDIEERLKILKKELDCFKDNVSSADEAAKAAWKKCQDENKKLRELLTLFNAQNDIRQEAYRHLQNCKRQLHEKNMWFRRYKGDETTANDYASRGDKEALHEFCKKQVERIMKEWNKNDDFRKEYIRCNAKSTLRRLRTFDGRALGPDEESPLLANVVDGRHDRSVFILGKANAEVLITMKEPEKELLAIEGENKDGKPAVKEAEQMDQMLKTERPSKLSLRNGSAIVSVKDETQEITEEQHEKTKEEIELARKAEESRKEEEEARLKEQRRMEEKAKEQEALERKRRNAEKAMARAELRAQKEAEQKEKEKEKKARKKERKKSAAAEGPDGNNDRDAQTAAESSPLVTVKETEIKESPPMRTKGPLKTLQFTKQNKSKSIPPPLRNKGKRRMQQWIWVILTAVLVFVVFLLGNIGFYSNLKLRRSSF